MPILGLDYGQKRIGVAISDELDFMAHAFGFIPVKTESELFGSVQRLMDEHQIKKIVIGLPMTLKGETGTQAQKVLAFSERLRNQVVCPVILWDERLTTAQAERALIDQDISRSKRRVKRDAIAAEIMLQSYLDFLKHKDVNEHV